MVLKKMHLPKQVLNILPLWIHPKTVTCKQAKNTTILQQVPNINGGKSFQFHISITGIVSRSSYG